MNCRHCGTFLHRPFLDLGSAPPSNGYLTTKTIHSPEQWLPLRLLVCENCWLVQTEDFAGAETLFSDDYGYFSSFSTTWLKHAEEYVATMVERFSLNRQSLVIEVAANDGYLLQFVKKREIPCLGIEPTLSTAEAAKKKGLTIIKEFFGKSLAETLLQKKMSADLITANNVLAHVPDINDFVAGFTTLLKPQGVATFEFPHLLNMVAENQFDTAYHEHYSYFSLTTVRTIFFHNGLQIFDVEPLATHGGSLRIYAQRTDHAGRKCTNRVEGVLRQERAQGIRNTRFYTSFQKNAEKVKNDFLVFLLQCREQGKSVAGYGAAAKGNTLLNFAGIKQDLLPYIVDRNPAKQNNFMPGSRIPIVDESRLKDERPDIIIILPWNLRDEIIKQLQYTQEWNAQYVTAIPALTKMERRQHDSRI